MEVLDIFIEPVPLIRGRSHDEVVNRIDFKDTLEAEIPLRDFKFEQDVVEIAPIGPVLINPHIDIQSPNIGDYPSAEEMAAMSNNSEDMFAFFSDSFNFDESTVEIAPTLKQEKIGIVFSLKEIAFFGAEIETPVIKCKICMTKQWDFQILTCSDVFCYSCINLVLINYIDTGKVYPTEIACPECKVPINDTIIDKHITTQQRQKILDLRISIKTQKLVAESKAIHCPIPDCKGCGYIFPGDTITACSECKAGVCIPCKKGVHPGISCEEYALQNPNVFHDDLLLSRNWKRCPNCGCACEREDGCNFITCTSPVCRGERALCNLCGKSLVEAQHFSHFASEGPFGTTCNTLDGTEEPPITGTGNNPNEE